MWVASGVLPPFLRLITSNAATLKVRKWRPDYAKVSIKGTKEWWPKWNFIEKAPYSVHSLLCNICQWLVNVLTLRSFLDCSFSSFLRLRVLSLLTDGACEVPPDSAIANRSFYQLVTLKRIFQQWFLIYARRGFIASFFERFLQLSPDFGSSLIASSILIDFTFSLHVCYCYYCN